MAGRTSPSSASKRNTASKRRLIITPDHRYFIGGSEIPGNTAVLRASGYGHGYGTASDMRRGRAVHKASMYLTERRLDWTTVAPSLLPYVAGWAAFLRVSRFRAKKGWVERPTYCKRYGFATRPDVVGFLNGRLAVVQIKSGGLDPSVEPQTAGEALAVEDEIGVRPERFAVVLPGNSWFTLKHLRSSADRPAFLSALTSWNNRRRQGWDGKRH